MYRNPCWWATQSERWQPGGGFWLRRWTVISSLIQTSQRELTLINKEKRGQWYTLLFLNYGPTNICSLHPPPTPKTFFFSPLSPLSCHQPNTASFSHTSTYSCFSSDFVRRPAVRQLRFFSTFVSYWCLTSTPSVRPYSAAGAHFSCSHLSHSTEQYESVDRELILFCFAVQTEKI